MQAIPSALLFIIPFVSVYFFFVRVYISRSVSSESRDKFSQAFAPYLAFFSLGILSVMAGSLGVVARSQGTRQFSLEAGESVIVSLIKLELGLSIIYFFATVIPRSIMTPSKVSLCNIALSFILACSTVFNILSPFFPTRNIPHIVAPILTLSSAISPLPLLAILLFSQATRLNSKATRFWLVLGASQIAAVLYSVFALLEAQLPQFENAFQIPESFMMICWSAGIMKLFNFLPSRHTKPSRKPVRQRPSKLTLVPLSLSPSNASAQPNPPAADISDFFTVHDPFASPPLSARSITSERTSFSYFSPPNSGGLYKPKIGRKSKLSLSSQNLDAPAPEIGPLEVLDFGAEEAMLSQLLLQNLDSDLDLTSEKEWDRRGSAAAAAFRLGLGFELASDSLRRDKVVIMTCERRGSESTIGGSIADHDYGPTPSLSPSTHHQRFTHVSTSSDGGHTTLYDPESPMETLKGKELPPLPDLPLSPHSCERHAHGWMEVVTGISPRTNSREQSPEGDDIDTPRARSPS